MRLYGIDTSPYEAEGSTVPGVAGNPNGLDSNQYLWLQARTIVDRAVAKDRPLTPKERGTWDALSARLDELGTCIKSARAPTKRRIWHDQRGAARRWQLARNPYLNWSAGCSACGVTFTDILCNPASHERRGHEGQRAALALIASHSKAKALRAERHGFWMAAREIAVLAVEEDRHLTHAEQERWDWLYGQIVQLDVAIARLLARDPSPDCKECGAGAWVLPEPVSGPARSSWRRYMAALATDGRAARPEALLVDIMPAGTLEPDAWLRRMSTGWSA
jgi:hypothetical protein